MLDCFFARADIPVMKKLVLFFLSVWAAQLLIQAENWPSFRGVNASGISKTSKPPTTWKEPRWKTAVSGLGHSSPIIWENKVFITSAVRELGEEDLKTGLYGDIGSVTDKSPQAWQVLCLDKNSGAVLWRRTVHTGVPRIKRHPKSSHANSTPATDGEHLVSFFGAEGLFCHDLEGKLLWRKDFGSLDSGYFAAPDAQWGFGSSPVIHDGRVIVQCDVQTNSFIAALDVKTGREIWKSPRRDVPTWSTPSVFVSAGRTQVVANGYTHAGGYDFATGKELWKMTRAGDIPVPTPILYRDLIFITSAHGRIAPIYAIRAEAQGDLTLPTPQSTNKFIAWSTFRGGTYMQTPIVIDGLLFACRDNGVLSCYRAETGEQLFSERLGKGNQGFTASPVSAGGHLYFTSEEGQVFVVKAGPAFEVIGQNDLGEQCMATPAIADDHLFFRTRHHLICIGKTEGK